jgi:hypothetical protein
MVVKITVRLDEGLAEIIDRMALRRGPTGPPSSAGCSPRVPGIG